MDEIALCEQRDVLKVIDPTVLAFAPLLKKKKQFILQVPKKSFKFGVLDRHELDIYYPLTPPTDSSKTPVMFFIYGGNYNTGEKSLSPKTFGLVYACLGAFFARRGYIVVIPDYRLVPGVQFPGPAEDVRDALRWVSQNPKALVSDNSPSPDIDRVAMMGHSAGAAHIATMLFHPDILHENDAEAETLRARIAAVILESPPYDLSAMSMDWNVASTHATYWNSLEDAKENDPLHLYRQLPDSILKKLPPILMVEGEREPEWLIDAGTVFNEEVLQRTGKKLKRIIALGHNHMSLNWALSTGQGEDWAEEVVDWLRALKA